MACSSHCLLVLPPPLYLDRETQLSPDKNLNSSQLFYNCVSLKASWEISFSWKINYNMAKWRLIKLNRSHASLLQICPYSLGRKTNKSTSSKSDTETQKCSSETTKPEIPINFANFLSHSRVSLSTIFWSCQQTAACYESCESAEGPRNHTFAGWHVHVDLSAHLVEEQVPGSLALTLIHWTASIYLMCSCF